MSMESHLAELVEKHRALERRIEEELARPYADDFSISQLKKKKLRLKEVIERIRGETLVIH